MLTAADHIAELSKTIKNPEMLGALVDLRLKTDAGIAALQKIVERRKVKRTKALPSSEADTQDEAVQEILTILESTNQILEKAAQNIEEQTAISKRQSLVGKLLTRFFRFL